MIFSVALSSYDSETEGSGNSTTLSATTDTLRLQSTNNLSQKANPLRSTFSYFSENQVPRESSSIGSNTLRSTQAYTVASNGMPASNLSQQIISSQASSLTPSFVTYQNGYPISSKPTNVYQPISASIGQPQKLNQTLPQTTISSRPSAIPSIFQQDTLHSPQVHTYLNNHNPTLVPSMISAQNFPQQVSLRYNSQSMPPAYNQFNQTAYEQSHSNGGAYYPPHQAPLATTHYLNQPHQTYTPQPTISYGAGYGNSQSYGAPVHLTPLANVGPSPVTYNSVGNLSPVNGFTLQPQPYPLPTAVPNSILASPTYSNQSSYSQPQSRVTSTTSANQLLSPGGFAVQAKYQEPEINFQRKTLGEVDRDNDDTLLPGEPMKLDPSDEVYHGKSRRSIELFENKQGTAFPSVSHSVHNPPSPVITEGKRITKLELHEDSCYNFLNKRLYKQPLENLTPLEQFFHRESIGQYKMARMLQRTSQKTYPATKPQVVRKKKYLLVLDIDETLVHSELVSQRGVQMANASAKKYDRYLEFPEPNGPPDVYGVRFRPFLMEFLQRMSKIFDLAVYTASAQDYADAVMDEIDPQRALVGGRLYRENCIQVKGMNIKNMENFVGANAYIVDNLIYSYSLHMDKGIPICPFVDDPMDVELKDLADILENLPLFNTLDELLQQLLGLEEYYDHLEEEGTNSPIQVAPQMLQNVQVLNSSTRTAGANMITF